MPFATAGELLAQKQRLLVTVTPSTGAGEAGRLMREHDIGFLPVLEGGKLVGVVSERDLVRGVHLARPTFVAEVMTNRVHTVGPEAKVPECFAIMDREHIRHLPVVNGDTIEGVLSIRDLAGSLVERHERLLRNLQQERIALLHPYPSSY
jgi:CBS domain-containing protein